MPFVPDAPASRFVPDQPAQPQPSMLDRLLRQGGLTARYGLEGLGGTLDLMASPIRAGLNALLPAGTQITGNTGEAAANTLGLPTPQNFTERVAGDISRTMAGTAGFGGAANTLSKFSSPAIEAILKTLADRQGMQAISAAGAGGAGGVAKESGVGPAGQMAASLTGGIAAPVVAMGVQKLGGQLADVGATIGSSFGNESGTTRLAKDAVNKIAGDSKDKILATLRNAPEEYMPGVKPTVSDSIAQANIGQPSQFGGGVIKLQKNLSGAAGIEDLLPSTVRAQKSGVEQYIESVKTATTPMREAALSRANANGGVSADSIVSGIDQIGAQPGIRASDIVQKTLNSVKEKLTSLSDPNGKIDANDLYTVRKEIGNTIATNAKETANWDKRLTSSLQTNIQNHIDDAIEASGGTGWKSYLNTYSTGMKKAEGLLAIQKEAKLISAGVKSVPASAVATGEVPKPPTLLSRPMMLLNWALRNVSEGAENPVAKHIATAMQDPQQFADLMARPSDDPARKVAQQLLLKALTSASANPPQNVEQQKSKTLGSVNSTMSKRFVPQTPTLSDTLGAGRG